jgi:enediyne biosynthesis protein E7
MTGAILTELIRTHGTPMLQAWLHSPCNVLYQLAKARPGQNLDLELGGAVFHLVQDAATARDILRDRRENYAKYFGSYARLFGESRLTVNGPRWRKLRDYSQSYITEADADGLVRTAQGFFGTACADLLARSHGQPCRIDDAIDYAAAATVSEMVLGFPIHEWGQETLADVRKILRLASWENFPQPSGSGVEQAFLALDAETAKADLVARFSRVLAERRQSDPATLISDLAGADPDEVDTFGEMATLLFAGFDTTASAVCWAMFLLARDPALQSRLRTAVKGMATDPNLRAADLLALAELNAFALETMRIFPPVPVLSRLARERDSIGDWTCAKDSRLLISIIGLQHDSRIFPDPFAVNLDRHPKGALTRESAPHFMPFGDGKRICPGARFANLELLVALAVVLDTMQLASSSGAQIQLRWDASMRQADGTLIAVTPRA